MVRSIELPSTLTHYYRGFSKPLLSLSALPPAKRPPVLADLARHEPLPFRLGHPDYMPERVRIESLMRSATEVCRAYAQGLIVDRAALSGYQEENDALMASETLKAAFRTDVEPILAMARQESGGAIDPVSCYRAAGYRAKVAAERPAVAGGGGGIV